MNFLKKNIVIAVLLLVLFPMKALAVVPPLLSYGGVNTVSLPCTCTGGAVWWAFYTPLYLTAIPIVGPIDYVLGASFLFADFIPPIESFAPYKGAYLPGVPLCWMGVPPYCFPMPTFGTTVFTGTGLPGGI